MTFHWSSDIGDFFFNGLTINTVPSLVILSVVLIILSVIYEGFKVHSASVRARAAREQICAISCAPSETANLLITDQNGPRTPFLKRFTKFLGDVVVFLSHNALGYALMLSVMVYSGWLFVAVIFGMGLGYFVFGHISMKINMENVQARTTKVICAPGCSADGVGVEVRNGSVTASPSRDSSVQPSTSTSTLATVTLPTISCQQEKNETKLCDSSAPCC